MFVFIILSILSPSLGQNSTDTSIKPIPPVHPRFTSPFYRHLNQPLPWGGFGLHNPHFRSLPLNQGYPGGFPGYPGYPGYSGYPGGYQVPSGIHHNQAALYGSPLGSHCNYFCTLPTGHYGCCDTASTNHPGTCPVNPPRSECPANRRSSSGSTVIGASLPLTASAGSNRRSDTLMMGTGPYKCNLDMECPYSHRCCWDVCFGYRTCKPADFTG